MVYWGASCYYVVWGIAGGGTGICPPLEIGTKNQKFPENVKSAELLPHILSLFHLPMCLHVFVKLVTTKYARFDYNDSEPKSSVGVK